MDLSDFKSLRRWSDLPRKFAHLSRMAYMIFLAVTGLFLVTLSWVMLQPPTVVSTSSSSSIDYTNGKAPAAAPTVAHTPIPTPELSSVTIHHSDEGTSHVDHSATPLIKPDGLRIVGVIFYGRRDRSSLLECYLRKNLVSYGGWLDEVIWAANTDDADDLAYGEHIAATQNEYTYLPLTSSGNQGEGYMNIYRHAFTEPDTIYVKMDDDVVFIDQSAIPRVVMTLLNNPRALLVSANVVNNPALGWVHYHMGAVHPYVPEVKRPDGDNLATKENGAWRSSDLPTWSGAEWEMPELDHFYSLFGVNDKTNVPLHRWIPTRNLSLLYKTPVAKSEYNAFGNNLHFWPLAAQAHYSLLQNIEEKRLGRYFMVHGSDEEAVSTWDMNGSRISINFMVIKGKDIIDNISNLQPDDENKLTVELPTLLNRAVLVETTSVVSHFSFGPQKNLAKTDILARYHNYANQNICPNAILEPEVLLATDKMPGVDA
ncbi:hypothetical protein TCE0_060r19367 [Talaromyces pinophilus]|uniref:Uncharacterized protein n=1 Tax=Talaromyces pinophilus TaxID=128442 RepID=A0A6V8HQL6_TALPI|nr:Hypothetical protein PENO1_040670 [Penicillium occitanis (nom. inval.)]PCH02734.1 hypothetical protein PENOC_042270 [Penicillium occitanis (nom. inval.)]GAM44053.1 hypothetical protein TCE0_060r19367 [Talaromyces pinophilus]